MERKKIIFLTTLLLLLLSFTSVFADSNDVYVFVKGNRLYDYGILKDSRTFVPVRAVGEILDFEVNYRASDRPILVKKDNREIEFLIDSKKAYIDGEEKILNSEVFLKDGMTYVPLRFISEALNEKVAWDGKHRIAMVGEYIEDSDKKDTYLYYNKDFGFTLNLPNAWKEEVVLEEKKDGLNIYDKKTLEKFEKNNETCGPTVEIRIGKDPVIADLPYELYSLLNYDGETYIEGLVDLDFQYYEETKESYLRVQKESREVFKTIRIIDDEDIFVEDDIRNFKDERLILEDIVDKYVPKNIFDMDRLKGYRYPLKKESLLYLANVNKVEETSIKIEAAFDKNNSLNRYHLKNYDYDIKEGVNKIGQKEALDLANRFIKEYVDKKVELIKIPDLYPSLYEEGKHECYGDLEGKYIVVVDLENGFVEFFVIRD